MNTSCQYESWSENDFFKQTNVQRKVDDLPFKEGLPLVGFKYRKGYDWLDSKLHCSYLESRGVPERKKRGKYGKKAREIISLSFSVPVHDFRRCNFRSLPVMSFPVMQLPVTSFPVTSQSPQTPFKCELSCAHILLRGIDFASLQD